ncbi:hypothetical protein D3C75_646410 [compost metagenome]
MGQYFAEAKELAALFNGCYNVSTLPEVPVSNMFHVHFALSREQVERILIQVSEETGVGFTPRLKETGESSCAYELSIGDLYSGIAKAKLEAAFGLLDRLLREA